MKLRKFRALVNQTGLDDLGMSGIVFRTETLIKGKIYHQADERKYGELVTKKLEDYKILSKKETNKIDLTEIYIFLKKIDKSFKIKDNITYNNKIKIKYLKLLENSELFIDKKNLSSDSRCRQYDGLKTRD